jgi:DNA-binding NtrC family response regulator
MTIHDLFRTEARSDNRLTCLLTEHAHKRVLLIEDDPNLVRGLSRFLRRRAFDLLVEHRGDIGLATALSVEPDAVVLDLGLPGMRGTKILEELQRQAPDLPVVVISGDLRWRGGDCHWGNVIASFRKPFPAAALVQVLDTTLGLSQR